MNTYLDVLKAALWGVGVQVILSAFVYFSSVANLNDSGATNFTDYDDGYQKPLPSMNDNIVTVIIAIIAGIAKTVFAVLRKLSTTVSGDMIVGWHILAISLAQATAVHLGNKAAFRMEGFEGWVPVGVAAVLWGVMMVFAVPKLLPKYSGAAVAELLRNHGIASSHEKVLIVAGVIAPFVLRFTDGQVWYLILGLNLVILGVIILWSRDDYKTQKAVITSNNNKLQHLNEIKQRVRQIIGLPDEERFKLDQVPENQIDISKWTKVGFRVPIRVTPNNVAGVAEQVGSLLGGLWSHRFDSVKSYLVMTREKERSTVEMWVAEAFGVNVFTPLCLESDTGQLADYDDWNLFTVKLPDGFSPEKDLSIEQAISKRFKAEWIFDYDYANRIGTFTKKLPDTRTDKEKRICVAISKDLNGQVYLHPAVPHKDEAGNDVFVAYVASEKEMAEKRPGWINSCTEWPAFAAVLPRGYAQGALNAALEALGSILGDTWVFDGKLIENRGIFRRQTVDVNAEQLGIIFGHKGKEYLKYKAEPTSLDSKTWNTLKVSLSGFDQSRIEDTERKLRGYCGGYWTAKSENGIDFVYTKKEEQWPKGKLSWPGFGEGVLNPMMVPLGVNAFNESVLWNAGETPMGIICGPTGSGKSVTLQTILGHALASDSNVWCADPKEQEFPWVRGSKTQDNSGLADRLAIGHDACYDLIIDALKEMNRRKALIVNEAYRLEAETGLPPFGGSDYRLVPGLKPLFIFIDEIFDLLSVGHSGGKKVTDEVKERQEKCAAAESALGSLLRLGRSRGIRVVLACQKPYADTFKGEFKGNTRFRVWMSRPKQSDAQMLFDGTSTIIDDVKGRGLIEQVGMEATEVQFYFADPKEIYEALIASGRRTPLRTYEYVSEILPDAEGLKTAPSIPLDWD